MKFSEEILTELNEIAPLLGTDGYPATPYSVPSLYFTQFADLLMDRIRLEASGFSETASTEISNISPLLAGLRNKNTYQAPEGFFDSLNIKIVDVANLPETPVFSIDREAVRNSSPGKRIISMPVRVLRYAMAACIVALLGIGVYKMSSLHTITDPIKGLASVSDQDMASYLDADDIHWTPGVTSVSETASVEFTDNEIHELLSNVPDDELVQYASSLPVKKGTVN